MKSLRCKYDQVYYADLDNPARELEKLEKFLIMNVDMDKIALVNVDQQSNEIFTTAYDGKKESLIDYAFIRSDLAGVGNYNFIIESKQPLRQSELADILKKHLRSKFFRCKFFEYKWVEELLNERIADSILITYCDGVWVDLIKK